MDTFELLPSLAQGELGETSAPELVAAVFRSRASGTLWLETADGSEVRVFFRAGDMCGSGTFSGFQTLAQVLLAHDWVNALDIDASRTEAEAKGKRHGEILVANGLLTPEKLRTALAAQHRQNLAAVLALTEGKYDWRGWEPPPNWAREVVVDPVSCIADAFESGSLAGRRARIVAWLGSNAARLSVDWPELQERIELRSMDKRAAAMLALPRTLEEFKDASGLPPQRAEALLVALLLAGGVEPQAAAPGPSPSGAPSRPPMPEEEPRKAGPAPARRAARAPATPTREAPESEPLVPELFEDEPLGRPVEADPFAEEPLEGEPLEGEPLEGEPLEPDPFDEPLAPPAPLPRPSAPPQKQAPPARKSQPPASAQPPPPRSSSPPRTPAAPAPRPKGPPAALVDDLPASGAGLGFGLDGPNRPARSEQEAIARLDLITSSEISAPGGEATAPEGPHDELELAAEGSGLELETGHTFHPSRGGSDALDGSPDEPIPGLEIPGSRPAGSDARGQEMRKKLLARGMRNLGGARGQPEAEAPPEQPLERPQPVTGPLDLAVLGPEDRRFVEEVRVRAKLVSSQSAYARLGVPLQAPAEAIKAAYIQAAKRFHPDRAAGPLEALGPELQLLFTALKEAYDAISSPDARARYDELTKGGANKPTTRKGEAALAVKMGDALLKKRDFEGAIARLRRGVELDANADALAALAWALVCDPKQPAPAKEEAASLINRALRAPGPTARTYYVAGVLWRTKDPESAVDAFRKALELEPSHPDASLELRLLESRRGKTGGGVLSGLLFGKRKDS